jgi:hypothetical protein
MRRIEKTLDLELVLRAASDANIAFSAMQRLLLNLAFEERAIAAL